MDNTTTMPLERVSLFLLLILVFAQHTLNFLVALSVAQISLAKDVQLMVAMEHMLVSKPRGSSQISNLLMNLFI
jgi:hypothetical protein